jgi:hypothetical protein
MPADLVLTNANVYTVDAARSRAEALAIKDGRIVAVGTAADVEHLIGGRTQVLDVGRRLVLPGFIDSHMHAQSGVEGLYALPLHDAQSRDDCLRALATFAGEHPEMAAIRGGGWPASMIREGALLATQIDAVVADRPVMLSDDSYHLAWVNSAALRLAGIDARTPDPDNGVIDRLPDGSPSGLLREGPVVLVERVLPCFTDAQVTEGLLHFQTTVAGPYGLTTVQDAGVKVDDPALEGYTLLQRQDRLTARYCISMWIMEDRPLDEQIAALQAERERQTCPLVRMRTAKLFADGVIEGHTGYLKEPYVDSPGDRGQPMCPPEQFTAMAVAAAAAGLQIHIHAIGDAAVEMSLDAIEAAERAGGGDAAARPLITHLELVDPADFSRFAALGVVAVPQPYWFHKETMFHEILVPFLGKSRAERQYPMKSFWDHGVVVASASDYPVSPPPDPLLAIQRGVLRRAPERSAQPGALWPEEAVTVEQMIESFTINGAFANFLEEETGSIEVGKSADLVALSRDILACPPEQITEAQVELTVFEGRPVYAGGPFAGLT